MEEYWKRWDDVFKHCGKGKPEYDLWLDKFEHILTEENDNPAADSGGECE